MLPAKLQKISYFFLSHLRKRLKLSLSGSKFASIDGSRKGVVMSNLNDSECDSESKVYSVQTAV